MKKMRIDLYTHFFKVSHIHPSVYYALRRAFQELLQTQFVKIRGKVQKQNKNIFAAKSDEGEYRFHINYLPRFKEFLRDGLINDDEINYFKHEYPEPAEIDVKVPEKFQMRDYQEEALSYILDEGHSKLIAFSTGMGKGLLLDTLVKIPNGWKQIGDIKVGDYVNTPNGDKAKVTGVYDNKQVPCYKITFADGRNIVCDEDHLWEVFTHGKGRYTTLNTKELDKLFNAHINRKMTPNERNGYGKPYSAIYIPLVDPTHSADEDVELPLDPYLLGVYLGDGWCDLKGRLSITKPDVFLFNTINDIVQQYGCMAKKIELVDIERCLSFRVISNDPANKAPSSDNDIARKMIELGLNGKYSWNKFIPEVYMNSSFNQRLELIRGLMDTDGTQVKEMSCAEYTTTSEILAKQMVELLRSVGCQARYKSRQTTYTYNGEVKLGRISYKVRIRAPIPSLLFKTPSKIARCKDINKMLMVGLKLRVINVERVGNNDTRCIEVDHPDSMYVIQDYICTHNTVTASKAGELLGYRTIIIVLGRYKEKWRDDVLELYGPDTNFILIKGLAHLLSIIEQAKEGQPVPDVIIVTTTTMQLYIKEWEKHQGKEIEGMVPPEEMYEILKIGYRIIDEAHQHFHMVFKNDLYSNLYKAVYLTATLESNDKFIQAMYNLIWPRNMRGQAVKPAPYDKTTALLYQHLNPDRVRWKSNQGYSHVMYEQSIWKHIPSRVEYLDMIGDVVEQKFLPLYEPGKKMLIFCSLVDTCKEVADYLNQRFKDKKWQISKFTAEDNKEIIDTNDITVSTLGKAGTALDISGLIVCFNTVALAEPKANLQAKGRLRDLSKKPGFEHIVPEYIYTVATDIPRHVQYHQEKKMLFAGRTTRIAEERAPYTIGQSLGEYFRFNLKSHWDHIKMENLKLHDKIK